MYVIIKIVKGDMKVEFYEKDVLNMVVNFVKLVKEGYYNGLMFYCVFLDFVIQGGCLNICEGVFGMLGMGGLGYKIDCELNGDNQYYDCGVFFMVYVGRNIGGLQFFICYSCNNMLYFDRNYICFGKVMEGVDIIDDICQNDCIEEICIEE